MASSAPTTPRSLSRAQTTEKPLETPQREPPAGGGNKVAPIDDQQGNLVLGPSLDSVQDGETEKSSSDTAEMPDRLQNFHRNSIAEGGIPVVPPVDKIGDAGRIKGRTKFQDRMDKWLGVLFHSSKLQPRLDAGTSSPRKIKERQWKWYLHFVDEDLEEAHDEYIFDVVHPVARNICLWAILLLFILNTAWWASYTISGQVDTTVVVVNMVILGGVEVLAGICVYFFVEKDFELPLGWIVDWRTLYACAILANVLIFGWNLKFWLDQQLEDLDKRFMDLSLGPQVIQSEIDDFLSIEKDKLRDCFTDRFLVCNIVGYLGAVLAQIGFIRSFIMAVGLTFSFTGLVIFGFEVDSPGVFFARCFLPMLAFSYVCLLILNHIDAMQRLLFVERYVDHKARDQLRKQNVELVKRNNLLNHSLESFTRKGAGFNDVKFETPLQTSISILTQLKESLNDPEASKVLDQVMITLRKTEKLNKIDISQKLQESNGEVTSEFKDWLGEHFSTERKQSVLPEKRSGRVIGKNGRLTSSRSNSTSSLMGTFGSSFFDERRGSRCDSNILSNVISKKRDNEKIREVLSLWNEWNFNLFELVEVSTANADGLMSKDYPQPLLLLGMTVFDKYSEIRSMYQIEEKTIHMFLHRVEKTYCFDPEEGNEYHTSWHAADVLQTVCCVMQTQIIAVRLSDLDKLTLIVAAIMHDYRHKGVTNKYLIQVKDDIAYDHNDQSVLERFHLQQTFVVLRDPKFNFLANLTEHDFREFRRKLILLILATDLGEGFKYIASFKNAVESEAENENTVKEPLMQMILKLADVSHPCKEWDVHRRWTGMITKEFYKQGRMEASRNIPISPLCDETKADIAKSQQGFINFVVNPIVQPLAEYCSNFVWTRQLHENYQRWGSEQMNSKKLESVRSMGSSASKIANPDEVPS